MSLSPKYPDFRLEAGMRVLDIGCGEGDLLRHLGGEGFGIDIDPGAIRRGGVRGACALAEALPFPSAAFNTLACRVAFAYMEPDLALSEFRRVLRDGGTFWMCMHGPRPVFRRAWSNLKRGAWKDLVFCSYILVNSGWFALSGKVFRFPVNRQLEFFETRLRLERKLREHGFEVKEWRGGAQPTLLAQAVPRLRP